MAVKTLMKSMLKLDTTVESTYDHKNNNFHFIRFFLAILVIYSHSYILLNGPGTINDDLARLTNNHIDFGRFAVYCFFVISGFLITQSALNSKSTMEFITSRFLRIVPAFLASLLLVAFVIGPVVTNLSTVEYFQRDTADPYNFVMKNITFGVTGFTWEFKEVFSGNPHSNKVNGSMWTLSHEMACYILVGLLLFSGLIRKKFFLIFLQVIFIALLIAYFNYGYMVINKKVVYLWVINFWNYDRFIILAYFFISGSLLYVFKDKIPYNKKIFVVAVVGVISSILYENIRLGLLLFLPYIVMYCCIGVKFAPFQKYGDYSYGLYIFAFPLQQTILHFNKNWTLPQFFVVSSILSLSVAFVSWHIIEKRALRLKTKLRQRRESSSEVVSAKTV